jgi:hypothetical protein
MWVRRKANVNNAKAFNATRADAQRKAHWPGAAASGVSSETQLNRLLPVQWSVKLGQLFIRKLSQPSVVQSETDYLHHNMTTRKRKYCRSHPQRFRYKAYPPNDRNE